MRLIRELAEGARWIGAFIHACIECSNHFVAKAASQIRSMDQRSVRRSKEGSTGIQEHIPGGMANAV